MTTSKPVTNNAYSATIPVLWINRALESLWLLTLIVVPLAFLGRSYGEWSSAIGSYELPKITILRTLAGLTVALWLTEWVLKDIQSKTRLTPAPAKHLQPSNWLLWLRVWLRDQPMRWLTLAVLLLLGSTLLSTFLSASFSVSMWGDIPGQDSYSTYTVVAYLVVFGVIATHLRTRPQLWRLLGTIVSMGVLVAAYGIFQHYGHDFLDLMEPPNTQRVSSTLGNATFAGAVLLLTIPVSLMLAIKSLKGSMRTHKSWSMLVLWVLIIAVQLLGIAFTSTRGPWFGTVFGLSVLLGLTAIFLGWRELVRAALALGLASIITAAVLALTSVTVGRADPDSGEITIETGASVVAGRIAAVGQATFSGGLGGRFDIWQGSWRLMTDHPWFGFDTLSQSSIRPIIGYGPEFFRETYLLESPPGFRRLPSEPANAHNLFIQQGVEQGYLGILTYLGVFTALFLVGGVQLFKGRRNYSRVHKLLLAVLLATLAGRLLEQMVGVARVSDLTVFWVLLGTFVALPTVMTPHSTPAAYVLSPHGTGRPTGTGSRRFSQRASLNWALLLYLAMAIVVVGIGVLTWTKSINYFRAAIIVDQSAQDFRNGRLQRAMASLDHAIDLAPDVSTYYGNRATVYVACLERGAEGAARNQIYEVCGPERQHARNQQWVERRPFNFRSRLALADSAVHLGLLKEDAGLIEESTRLYREAVEMIPSSWPLWNRLAEVYLLAGRPDAALETLERSLQITGDTELALDALLLQARGYHALGQPEKTVDSVDQAVLYHPTNAEAYYIRGTAHYGLGQFSQALKDLDQAILLDAQQSLAYNTRGLAHVSLGQFDSAVEDFTQTVRLDPDYANAYNNRGMAFRELGNLERAIEDLDRAIELDPEFTIAYFNRALAHNLLGEDAQSEADGRLAVELGFDPSVLEAAMAHVRDRRASQ